MKTSKPKSKNKLRIEPRKPSPQPRAAVPHKSLSVHKVDNRQFIEFPLIKGRILERIEFSTAPDFHSLTLYFQDKTSLTLAIEPCFLMAANFADRSSGEQRILKRWPAIRSATEK